MTIDIDSVPFSWVQRELRLDRDMVRGDRGKAVQRIQEWLTLNGIALVIDGQFGPATEYAVGRFQGRRSLPKTGVVDTATFTELTEPLHEALAPPSIEPSTLSSGVVSAARQHLKQRPREVGGANRGPWVRVYMEGKDGSAWLWCAGFACFMVRQAAWHSGSPLPLQPTFGCDELSNGAIADGRFVPEAEISAGATTVDALPRGTFFVQRKTDDPPDWNHVGVVVASMGAVIETIEGNTNEGGSREGYEVCRRIRNLKKKDFVTLQPLES